MKKDKEYFPWIWLTLIIFIVIFCWFATWSLSYQHLKDLNDRANFGNMFGSVNALFSGLAMAGIIVAIFLQKKDLAIQREDLKLQRNELAQTRKEFEIQNETLKKQRFENSFFNLLKFHLDLRDNLLHDKSNGVFRGLLGAYQEITKRKGFEKSNPNYYFQISDPGELRNVIVLLFKNLYEGQRTDILNYFLDVYNCFKFIYDSTQVNESEKVFYASYIKAQLSPDEMHLIFYYSIVPDLGYPRFTYLIHNYKIFENLDLSKLHPLYPSLYSNVFEKAENPFIQKS